MTRKGIDFLSVLIENARWRLKYKDVNNEDAEIAKTILSGGTRKIKTLMKALEKKHLEL